MKWNRDKLKGLMKEKHVTQEILAKELNQNKSTISKKMNCKSDFTEEEIYFLMQRLDIEPTNLKDYFFNLEVR